MTKHSSLLRKPVIYGQKKFYNIGPWYVRQILYNIGPMEVIHTTLQRSLLIILVNMSYVIAMSESPTYQAMPPIIHVKLSMYF
jgi:hypothetical protein